MPVSCTIKSCKSTKRKNNLEITFHKFPLKNEKILKYWIAATGRDNWIPYLDARICSLHFVNNDYYNDTQSSRKRYLKPDVIPTQHVHTNILQVFQQDTANNIKCNAITPNNDVISEDLTNQQTENYEIVVKSEDNPKNNITWEEDLTNQQSENYETIVVSKCSNCLNFNDVLLENQKLRKILEDLKVLQEKRLNQQAEMFHTLMRNNEAALKQKLEVVGRKNKTLNKSIKRKGENIKSNLKSLIEVLKSRNISENDNVFKLIKEFGNIMPSYCSVANCFNNSEQSYALFRYPQDEKLRRKWISAIGRDENWSPSSSQRVCEVHFKPSDIEFIAGRKRVKCGAVPFRFCVWPSTEDRENCLRRTRHDHTYNANEHKTSCNMQKKQTTLSSQSLSRQKLIENNERLKYIIENDHTYVMSGQQKPLTSTILDKMSIKKYFRKKTINLVKHQYGCVKTCEPLITEEIKAIDQSEDITEEKDNVCSQWIRMITY